MTDKEIIILDGGMGRELEQTGAPFRQPEWSALALMEAPHLVKQAHKNFINAGAEIITTNSYALVPFHIGEQRFLTKGPALIKLSAQLAQEAANESRRDVRVAGCIPPLFGSYRPKHFENENVDYILRPLIEHQDQYIDFWLIETLSSVEEARTIITEIKKCSDKEIWSAFTLADEEDDIGPSQLRSGRDLEEALQMLHDEGLIMTGVLFNCSQPEYINDAVKITASYLNENDYSSVHLGAYANSFERKNHTPANVTITDLRADITPERYLELSQKWIKSGANIIGGCCGIGPNYIDLLAKNLK